jgi:hypothetical protein
MLIILQYLYYVCRVFWIILAGDHHPDEVIFSYHFIKLYCNNYLQDNGKLEKVNKKEIIELINNILEKQDFYSDFFKNNNEEFYNYLLKDVQEFLDFYLK